MRLLIIDDNETVAFVMCRSLRSKGYEIVGVETAESFKAEIDKGGFDCVLVDAIIPGIDGADLVRHAKAAGCAVMAFSGHDEEHPAVQELMDAGADDFMWKPFTDEEFAKLYRLANGNGACS